MNVECVWVVIIGHHEGVLRRSWSMATTAAHDRFYEYTFYHGYATAFSMSLCVCGVWFEKSVVAIIGYGVVRVGFTSEA